MYRVPMRPDPELSALIAEAIDAGLLRPGTSAHQVATRVALAGQHRLTPAERRVWEDAVLPILAKPIAAQVLIGSLVRRGNRLPRRVA